MHTLAHGGVAGLNFKKIARPPPTVLVQFVSLETAVKTLRLALPLALAASLCTHPLLAQEETGTVEVTVAIVGDELEIRPVPLYGLELVAEGDSVPVGRLSTNLSGAAALPVSSGVYRLRSVEPAEFQGVAYTWDLEVVIEPSQVTRVELTNANAIADTVAVAASEYESEIELYAAIRSGVVRVDADLSHGTGFFIEHEGLGRLVVTNDHVVRRAKHISVVLDSVTRVPAQVVVEGVPEDLALLRINPDACSTCSILSLADFEQFSETVKPGMKVVAVGFPLSQRSTVTSGIISSVRESALITDVNINPGNSGGPLLSMHGQVVAVNTFGEAAGSGPGISGSVTITELQPLLEAAKDRLADLPEPELKHLPMFNGPYFPLDMLRTAAYMTSHKRYNDFDGKGARHFELRFETPLYRFVLLDRYEREIADERREREYKAGVAPAQLYSVFDELQWNRNWLEYVGNLNKPVVAIRVTPKEGETTWSAIATGLAAAGGTVRGQREYKFKGDVRDVSIFRNGNIVNPLVGGTLTHRVYIDNALVEMKDVADEGYYVLLPEVFRPDSVGVPPSIIVAVDDLKHPQDSVKNRFELPRKIVARIWNDFEHYYSTIDPETPFIRSDPDKFESWCGKAYECKKL